jgi:hypothetical protein
VHALDSCGIRNSLKRAGHRSPCIWLKGQSLARRQDTRHHHAKAALHRVLFHRIFVFRCHAGVLERTACPPQPGTDRSASPSARRHSASFVCAVGGNEAPHRVLALLPEGLQAAQQLRRAPGRRRHSRLGHPCAVHVRAPAPLHVQLAHLPAACGAGADVPPCARARAPQPWRAMAGRWWRSIRWPPHRLSLRKARYAWKAGRGPVHSSSFTARLLCSYNATKSTSPA